MVSVSVVGVGSPVVGGSVVGDGALIVEPVESVEVVVLDGAVDVVATGIKVVGGSGPGPVLTVVEEGSVVEVVGRNRGLVVVGLLVVGRG